MKTKAYFARHAQTLVGSLGGIVRHPFASLMTMAVIALALALPMLLNLFLQNARVATGNWNEAFNLTVYLGKKAAAGRAPALAKQLRLRGDVTAVRVITADEAMAQFRGDSGFGKALDALTDNPLPDTLVVTPSLSASSSQGTDTLKESIAALPDVQLVQLDTEWVKRLHALLDVVRRVALLSFALLAVGIVLIVSNTIRLEILNRRTEIEVMKLVGASDGFARRPFLYSGVWYGLGGGILAVGLVTATALFLAGPVQRIAMLYGSGFRLRGLGWPTGLVVLTLAAALAWIGSWLAATRHIRQIEPS